MEWNLATPGVVDWPEMPKPVQVKVGLYARVSTSKQEDLNQLLQLRTYAKDQGWKVVEEYVDHAVSGASASREKFRKLMDDAHKKRFNTVLFWSLDRFSREGVEQTLRHLRELNEYGVHWVSHEQRYLTSLGSSAEVVVSILSWLAKQERIHISDRTRAGMARVKAINPEKHMGRPRLDDARRRVHELRGTLSVRRIAEEVGISKASVERMLKEPPPAPPPDEPTNVVTMKRRAAK